MMNENKGNGQANGDKPKFQQNNWRGNDRGNGGDDQFNPGFMMRTFIEIQGNRYDMDEIKSVELEERYDDTLEGMAYIIVLNRLATVKNHLAGVEIKFSTREEREEAKRLIYTKMDSVSNVLSV